MRTAGATSHLRSQREGCGINSAPPLFLETGPLLSRSTLENMSTGLLAAHGQRKPPRRPIESKSAAAAAWRSGRPRGLGPDWGNRDCRRPGAGRSARRGWAPPRSTLPTVDDAATPPYPPNEILQHLRGRFILTIQQRLD